VNAVQKIKMEGVMRKKLMSCIVAFMFMMSIGTNALIAAESAVSNGGSADSSVLGDTAKTVDIVPDRVSLEGMSSNEEINKIYSRFTNVFNYSAGVLISVVGADGGFTLFEGGAFRASFTQNENGTYSISAFGFRPGDIDIIEGMPGVGGQKIMNFFVSILGEDAAKKLLQVETPEFDSDGNLKVYESAEDYANRPIVARDVAWLGVLYDHLKKGINYGATIDFQAAGGAELTLSINGQPRLVYGAQGDADNNPVVKKEYIYNGAGFLFEIRELSYKLDLDSLGDGYENVKKENENKSLNEDEKMSLYAQTDGTAKFTKTYTSTRFNAFGQPAYTADAEGHILSQFFYSSTGSMQSMLDLQTNQRSYFLNGQFDFAVNAEGSIITKAFRFQNGLTDCMINYNDGIATQMTVFYNNQPAITISMAGSKDEGFPILSANDARELYRALKDPTMNGLNEWINKFITNPVARDAFMEMVNNAVKELDELELYEIDKDGNETKNRIENSHDLNVKYATINTLIAKFGVTYFAVYAQDLSNQALLRVLGLDKAFEVALMKKEEKEAEETLKELATQEKEMEELLKKIKAADPEQGQKLEDLDKDKDKTGEDKIDAASLTDDERKYYNWKTAKVEATNAKNRNNADNRKAAAKSIEKALQIMMQFNNGASQVMNASFSVSESEFDTYRYIDNATGKEITSQEATERLHRENQTNGSGNSSTTTTHTESITEIKKNTHKTNLSVNLSIMSSNQVKVGYTATHCIATKITETETIHNNTWVETNRYNSDPVVIGEQGGFVGADGLPLTNADGTPMTDEQIAQYIADGGVVYVSVKATDVNIMDGQGFQAVDGEEILVQVTDVDVFRELAANVGKQVMLMGDVRSDVNGKKAMVMNLNYGGGFKTGEANIASMKNEIIALEGAVTPELLSLIANDKKNGMTTDEIIEKYGWVASNSSDNSWLRGISGSVDAKWDMLVMNANSGGNLEKTPRVLLQLMATVMTLF